MQIGRQIYEAPYDRDALGEVYQQRREPFVERSMSSDRCRMLSLFCVQGIEQGLKLWGRALDGWEILSEEGLIRVSIENEQLVVNNTDTERSWRVDLS